MSTYLRHVYVLYCIDLSLNMCLIFKVDLRSGKHPGGATFMGFNQQETLDVGIDSTVSTFCLERKRKNPTNRNLKPQFNPRNSVS